ncbi:biotin/lipoyl-containing protein [Bacteroidota bacterium]
MALLQYSFKKASLDENPYWPKEHNIWSSIGFWRKSKQIPITNGDDEFIIEIINQNNGSYEFLIKGEIYNSEFVFVEKGEIDFTVNDDTYQAKISSCANSMNKISINGTDFLLKRNDIMGEDLSVESSEDEAIGGNNIVAPMPGKVFKIISSVGDKVVKGDTIIIIESMKMETSITATKDAIVKKINVNLGDMVEGNTVLAVLEEEVVVEEEK